MPNDDGELYPYESHLEGLKREREGLEARIAAKRPGDDPADLKARIGQVDKQINLYAKGDPATATARRGGSRTTAQRTDAPEE